MMNFLYNLFIVIYECVINKLSSPVLSGHVSSESYLFSYVISADYLSSHVLSGGHLVIS